MSLSLDQAHSLHYSDPVPPPPADKSEVLIEHKAALRARSDAQRAARPMLLNHMAEMAAATVGQAMGTRYMTLQETTTLKGNGWIVHTRLLLYGRGMSVGTHTFCVTGLCFRFYMGSACCA